jgi:aspartate aminotransferase-like enzyme/GNAT superfamily N-acetyltransferase
MSPTETLPATAAGSLRIKIAETESEFEQIDRLNHDTFAEEIPQHARNASGRLRDRFHAQNTYLICTDGDALLGMVAVRDQRPFSLDEKLPGLDGLLPPCKRPCEIRLLSVRREHRHTGVFGLLMRALLKHCLKNGNDLGVISGRVENIPLYEKLGFVAFGPRVGKEGAWYQPMYLDAAVTKRLPIHPDQVENREARETRENRTALRHPLVNVLPGPVAIAAPVRYALGEEPLSHRAPRYLDRLARAKARLLGWTGAEGVEILTGTGTLANDVVAGQLSLVEGRGAVLANGEFGERLVKHARGFRLDHVVHRVPESQPFDLGALEKRLDADPGIRWVWAVHCETSTGRLNPIESLRDLCRRRGLRLALDCISSLGVTPVDLRGVHLASGVSGKGIGAFTGLSLVFYDRMPTPEPDRLPRYLDLGAYAAADGTPYSGSSNLLAALLEALESVNRADLMERLLAQSEGFAAELARAGIGFLPCHPARSPAVFTIPVPKDRSSVEVGRSLESQGILVSCGSDYLVRANRIQICLMTVHERPDLDRLVQALRAALD